MNVLIVDDEPIAREIVESYCLHLDYVKVIGSVGNALEAKKLLEVSEIDLLLLDINMPVLDGMSFMKTLKGNEPLVVFTTAYREFGPEAFELNACDYLLKPFSLERFIIAVDKVRERNGTTSKQGDSIFVKSDGKIIKVVLEEVLYVEANGNFCKIVQENEVIQPRLTFTAAMEMFPGHSFIRSHRSFWINKKQIKQIEGNRVFVGETEVPIGQGFRDEFLKSLGLA